MPEWAQEVPQVDLADMWLYQAFRDLSTCRDVGEAVGPIPWTAVKEYFVFNQYDQDMWPLFQLTMREMDDTFIGWYADERDRKMRSLNSKV